MCIEEGGYICEADGEDIVGAAMAPEEVQAPLMNKENALESTPSSRFYPEVRRENSEVVCWQMDEVSTTVEREIGSRQWDR